MHSSLYLFSYTRLLCLISSNRLAGAERADRGDRVSMRERNADWVTRDRLGTYRDKNAVRVLGLAAGVGAHEISQALDVVNAHHVDVIIEAESLDECEVDLESDVTLVFLISG